MFIGGGVGIFSFADPSCLRATQSTEQSEWMLDTYHFIDPLEVAPPALFASVFAFGMPARLGNVFQAAHGGS